MDNIRAKLVNILIEYDRRQSTRPGFNRYALAHYMRGVEAVMDDLTAGKPIEAALKAAFCGSLLRHVATKLGQCSI